jgi:hypothetical protein
MLLMGTVSSLTFVTSPEKAFSAIYTPAAGEGFHTASAMDVTGNEQLSADIEVNYGLKKVTVKFDWESGREYRITVNFSKPTPSPDGTAPTPPPASKGKAGPKKK